MMEILIAIGLLAIVARRIYTFKTRNKAGRPEKFKWSYWLRNNSLDVALSVVLVLLAVMASDELGNIISDFTPIKSNTPRIAVALAGFAGDWIIEWFVGKTKCLVKN